MPKSEPVFDVFISHTAADSAIVKQLAEELRRVHLEAFFGDLVANAVDPGETFRNALVESDAVVVVYSQPSLSPETLLALGAAWGTNKPAFVLLDGSASIRLPALLNRLPVFPSNRISDLISAILSSRAPLTYDEIVALKDAYVKTSISTDQLATTPQALTQLAQQFAKKSGNRRSGDQLLRSLIRLRKQGDLPRLVRSSSGRTSGIRRS